MSTSTASSIVATAMRSTMGASRSSVSTFYGVVEHFYRLSGRFVRRQLERDFRIQHNNANTAAALARANLQKQIYRLLKIKARSSGFPWDRPIAATQPSTFLPRRWSRSFRIPRHATSRLSTTAIDNIRALAPAAPACFTAAAVLLVTDGWPQPGALATSLFALCATTSQTRAPTLLGAVYGGVSPTTTVRRTWAPST